MNPPRGVRVAMALSLSVGAGCGGQVTTDADGGADAVVDTGVDTGVVVDTAVDVATETPPRSPGTCTGGGTKITCAPGGTCSSATTGAVECTDGTGRPPGRVCGVIKCDIGCACTSAAESTCDCPVAVPGPLAPPDVPRGAVDAALA